MKKSLRSLLMVPFVLITLSATSQQWTTANAQTSFILYGMHFPPGQNDIGYAVGMQYTYDAPGVVVKTVDGGLSWSQIYPTMGEIDGLQAICFVTPNKGFAAGWNNFFIKTADGGANWQSISVGSDVWYFVDIEFWDDNNGVVTAVMNSGGSKVFRTGNGGFTWTTGATLPYSVLDICYADASTLYAVGTGNVISKSIDGGQSFSNIYQSTGITMGVDFANLNFGVVGGEDGKVLTTNDGGVSWSSFSTGYHSFYAVHVFEKDSAYVGGTDVDIYKTTNNGQSWSLAYNGSGSSSMYKFAFTPNLTGLCSGSQGKMLHRNAPINTNFEANKTQICTGAGIQFTDLSVGATQWDWSFEGGTPTTSTDQNPIVYYNDTGIYDVSLTASNTEQSENRQVNDYIQVTFEPMPELSGETQPCVNSQEIYQTVFQGTSAYSWEIVGGQIISQDNASLLVQWSAEPQAQAYVIVNESTGTDCFTIDSLSIQVDLCAQINVLEEQDFTVYPNPATETLFILSHVPQQPNLHCRVYSSKGNMLLDQFASLTDEKGNYVLNIKSLPSGVYFIEVLASNNSVKRLRFVKGRK